MNTKLEATERERRREKEREQQHEQLSVVRGDRCQSNLGGSDTLPPAEKRTGHGRQREAVRTIAGERETGSLELSTLA